MTALAARLQGFAAPVVVLGATGWLGRVALEVLAGLLGDGFPRRVVAVASRATQVHALGRAVPVRPLDDLDAEDVRGALLLHLAFRTRDRIADLGMASYVVENVALSLRVLDLVTRGRPAGVLLTSSGAVYRDGVPGPLRATLAEEPYGALKRLDEAAFAGACTQAGARLRVARVFNVAGRHMTKPERYALGSLLLAARSGEPLRVQARGRVVRSYVAVEDLVALALAELLDPAGEEQLTFDTAGSTVEVEELACAVRDALGRPDLPVLRDRDPSAPDDVYVGDGVIMAERMARHGLVPAPLTTMIRRSAETLP